jgi:glycosyltransferase involved in cell wall biosynthesis
MHNGIRRTVEQLYPNSMADVFHAHMALPDGQASVLLGRKYRKPVVVTFQATDLDITARRNGRCLKALRRVFEDADAVISPSVRLTRDFVRHFEREPVTIGYGIDPRELHLGMSTLRARCGDRRVLLSVSRLMNSKGVDLNLLALRRLMSKGGYDDLLYLVVGDGPERGRLAQLTTALGLEKHVTFVGAVPHHVAMEYMSVCDVFALPSWQETFGLVYIEAMAHGKPVIGCRGQGVDGIVTEGATGRLAEPRDVDSLVDALRYVLDHPHEARAMGEAARELVLAKYTWEESARQLMAVYRGVMD